MTHRLPERVVDQLNEAISSARMERASFDPMSKVTKVVVHTEHGYTEHNGTVTDFIKERTRLYRGSWIISRLEEILAWSESIDDGSMREYDLLGRLTGPWPNPEVLKQAAAEVSQLREEAANLRAFKKRVERGLAALSSEAES